MNVIGIGNYGLINSNYAKKTSTDEVQVSTSFADIVQNKFNTAEGTMSVGESQTKVYADKPLWHWHDGPFGYSAEVYKNEGAASEYGCIYDVWVNQSTNAKNTSSSDFSKTMDSAAEMSTVRSRESVHESVVTRHTEYTDPETNEKVPVDISYTTSYSKDGIVCGKRSDVGGKLSARELWSLSFESPGDYKKVQDFLKSFSNDERLTFATQESFWKDFLQDDFDIEGFREFYDSTDNGRIDIEKAMSEGRTMRETLTAQNAEYLNNKHFIGKVYSEEDLQPSWYKNGQIQLSEVYDPSVPRSTRITSTRGIERTNLVTNAKDMTLEEYKNYIHDTKKLKTDDQTVLMTAKEAQKMESNALSKYQEVQLVGTTFVGVSYTSILD